METDHLGQTGKSKPMTSLYRNIRHLHSVGLARSCLAISEDADVVSIYTGCDERLDFLKNLRDAESWSNVCIKNSIYFWVLGLFFCLPLLEWPEDEILYPAQSFWVCLCLKQWVQIRYGGLLSQLLLGLLRVDLPSAPALHGTGRGYYLINRKGKTVTTVVGIKMFKISMKWKLQQCFLLNCNVYHNCIWPSGLR